MVTTFKFINKNVGRLQYIFLGRPASAFPAHPNTSQARLTSPSDMIYHLSWWPGRKRADKTRPDSPKAKSSFLSFKDNKVLIWQKSL
jgi:hypothetical protein